jgi:cyanate lyase
MNRIEVTEKIIATKVGCGLKWFKVMARMDDGRLFWPNDADPGTGQNRQGDFLVERGRAAMADRRALQGNVGQCQTGRSVDLPVYELISVYEPTLKELIHEEFDDGINSSPRGFASGTHKSSSCKTTSANGAARTASSSFQVPSSSQWPSDKL